VTNLQSDSDVMMGTCMDVSVVPKNKSSVPWSLLRAPTCARCPFPQGTSFPFYLVLPSPLSRLYRVKKANNVCLPYILTICHPFPTRFRTAYRLMAQLQLATSARPLTSIASAAISRLRATAGRPPSTSTSVSAAYKRQNSLVVGAQYRKNQFPLPPLLPCRWLTTLHAAGLSNGLNPSTSQVSRP